MNRLSVNLDESLRRELERQREALAGQTGVRASLSAVAAGAIRRGLRSGDEPRKREGRANDN